MCHGVIKFCLRGLLPKQQEDTLFLFVDAITSVLAESHNNKELNKLKEDLNTAIALLERDFPVSIQVHKFPSSIFYSYVSCINYIH